jgi:hypothetical protein
MKRKAISIALAAALLLTMGLTTSLPVGAATEEDIQTAIDNGIEYLVAQQNLGTGQFVGEYGELAETSLAVLKLLDRAYETGTDPFQDDSSAPDYYMYHDNVVSGLDYILLQAGTYGPGTGIVFQNWGHETYNTGIAMMAIAASRTPGRVVVSTNAVVDGLTYQQVVQACVDYFVFAQLPDGAWRYWYLDDLSDQSNTGYAALGLRYAEEFGCTVPQAVKDNLSPWLDAIQDDVDGDSDDGGSQYTVGGGWVNQLKTGNLLFEFAFVGDTVGVGRVDDAVDYIERHWNDPNDDPGWQNNYQAMYCLMKGFEAQGIEQIEVAGSPVDWFDEIADHILATQNADGSWPWDYWGGPMLATEWALLTLEKIAPPPPPAEEAKVTGGGTVDWAERVTYGFTAQRDASGVVKGEAQLLHRDVGFKDHADVLYLAVSGTDAWIGAVITQSDDPAVVGQEIFFRVQDNGEGKKATGPDGVSSVVFGPAITALSRPALDLMPWTNGNVQIHVK